MAWFIFHENFDRRIALGMACLVAGAAVLSWSGTADPVQPARTAGHRRRLPRLGPRQQSDPQGLARRSAADRRAERPDRRPVQHRPWPVDGRHRCPPPTAIAVAGIVGFLGVRRQPRPVRPRPASSRNSANRRLFLHGALLRRVAAVHRSQRTGHRAACVAAGPDGNRRVAASHRAPRTLACTPADGACACPHP